MHPTVSVRFVDITEVRMQQIASARIAAILEENTHQIANARSAETSALNMLLTANAPNAVTLDKDTQQGSPPLLRGDVAPGLPVPFKNRLLTLLLSPPDSRFSLLVIRAKRRDIIGCGLWLREPNRRLWLVIGSGPAPCVTRNPSPLGRRVALLADGNL